MTTAIDSNILIALWNEDAALNLLARSALDAALSRGELVIAAPVYAELLGAPPRTELFLDSFCRETGISSALGSRRGDLALRGPGISAVCGSPAPSE